MNHKQEQRLRLFQTFAANLALYWNESNGRFICPLCLRVFEQAEIDHLSLAHIIPNALKSKKTTLACKDCNNRIGTEIEAHEVRYAHDLQAFNGKHDKTVTARIKLHHEDQESGSVGIRMSGTKEGKTLELQAEAVRGMSNPADIERLCEMFKEASKGSGKWRLELECHNTVNEHRAQLTYLHIAYLYLFDQFGYEWVFAPYAERVREQLRRPDEDIIKVRHLNINPNQEMSRTWSIYVLYHPAEALGFIVTFPPLEHLGAWTSVWMPIFGADDAVPVKFGGSFQLALLADLHPRLSDPSSLFIGSDTVAKVLQHNAPDLLARLTNT